MRWLTCMLSKVCGSAYWLISSAVWLHNHCDISFWYPTLSCSSLLAMVASSTLSGDKVVLSMVLLRTCTSFCDVI